MTSIDAFSSLLEPEGTTPRLIPTGTARAKLERQRAPGPPKELAARAALHDLPPELVHLAWDLVALEPGLAKPDREAALLLLLMVLLTHRSGSTRLAIHDEGEEAMLAMLQTLAGPRIDHAEVIGRIKRLTQDDVAPALVARDLDAYTPLIVVDGYAYMQRMLYLERRFAARFLARRDAPSSVIDVAGSLPEVLASGRFSLSPEQALAVERAATLPFSIVSGGPGTGKTSIVVALLRVLVRSGVASDRIALAAPTGKATNRMREAIAAGLSALEAPTSDDRHLAENPPTPQTLHRLLGFVPRTESFLHHENNRLPSQIVIVDESSMVDLAMMEHLLRALADDARLVLLGDADQLPSVEAGAVLRDLVRADGGRYAVKLTKSHRVDESNPAGRAITRFASGVNAGTVATDVEDGVRFVDARSPRDLSRFLDTWYASNVRGDDRLTHQTLRPYPYPGGAFRPEDVPSVEAVFQHHANHKLLCVTRQVTYPTGARAISDAIHQRLILDRNMTNVSEYLAGEPIMMLRNDYQRGLFNGDQGVILQVGIDGDIVRPTAVFRTAEGLEAFPLAQLEHRIERAYAMTVHKAQGSELDNVGIVLPSVDVPLLTREIIYTAATRARRSVTIVGHPELLRRAVERPLARDSGLAERLA